MRHLRRVSIAPAPARSLLVWGAQIEVLNGILDLVERVLDLVKGATSAE